jgi:hypothetical protein
MKGIIVACCAVTAALTVWAEKGADLPMAAKQAVAKMETAVILAKKKAVSELSSVATSETRAGKLESAVAVTAKIKELNEELAVLENKPSSKKGEEFIAGTWRMQNGVTVVLNKDNTFSAGAGNFNWKGAWRVEAGKLIVDSTIFVDTYDLPATKETRDGRSAWLIKGKNSKGEAVSMYKQE